MRARTFRGATLLEAVRAAREALGPDALVVAARRLEERRWLRGPRALGFEITVAAPPVAPASGDGDPVLAEMRRLGARLDSMAALWERQGRFVEELAELQRALAALGARLPSAPGSPEAARRRGSHVRIAGAAPPSDPTPKAVEGPVRR